MTAPKKSVSPGIDCHRRCFRRQDNGSGEQKPTGETNDVGLLDLASQVVADGHRSNDTWTVPCNTHNPASRARISPSATEPRKLKTPAGTRACGSRGVPPGRY